MLKDILRLMIKGMNNPKDIASEIGITEEQLSNRLDQLVRMGYLDSTDADPKSCEGSKLCMGCHYSSDKGRDCISKTIVTYEITEKGRKMAS